MANKIDQEALLGEVEDILRSMPLRETLRHPTDENLTWLGRTSAFVGIWNPIKSLGLSAAMRKFQGMYAIPAQEGYLEIRTLLFQAKHDLRMKTIGPITTAIGHGMVFDYFEELRKIIETATKEILFVDAYLDAEFVSRYLPHTGSGVSIQLLTGERKLTTLLPAVDAYIAQTGYSINVRSNTAFHDRYVILDQSACYQSGTSFKDGAKAAPTTLTQITDAFPAVLKTYQDLWNQAKVER